MQTDPTPSEIHALLFGVENAPTTRPAAPAQDGTTARHPTSGLPSPHFAAEAGLEAIQSHLKADAADPLAQLRAVARLTREYAAKVLDAQRLSKEAVRHEFATWIESQQIEPGRVAAVSSGDLYRAFRAHLDARGIDAPAMPRQVWGQLLRRRGFQSTRRLENGRRRVPLLLEGKSAARLREWARTHPAPGKPVFEVRRGQVRAEGQP